MLKNKIVPPQPGDKVSLDFLIERTMFDTKTGKLRIWYKHIESGKKLILDHTQEYIWNKFMENQNDTNDS